jgi:hypothetical protein
MISSETPPRRVQRSDRVKAAYVRALALVVFLSSCAHSGARSEGARTAFFYEVPLSCEVVRGQVCSNKARLVLLDVTSRLPESRVLMRPDGRVIALDTESDRQEVARTAMETVLSERKLDALPLTGEREATEREALRAGPAWLDADALTRQTEAGANWFARKLLARITRLHPLAPGVVAELERAFSEILLRSLLAEKFSLTAVRSELLAAASPHLSEEARVTLGSAYDAGLDTQLPEDPAQ